jgi:parvulin-like peptidyl-prolyl isomerase
MKSKREFSTSGDRAVKPFCPANFSLSWAQKWAALDNQRQTGVLSDSSLRSKAVFRLSKTVISASLVLLSSLLLVSCADNASKGAGSEVAARVGSREITLRQIDSLIKQQIDQSGGGKTLSPAELVAARLTVLDSLIQEEAMFQKAQKEGLVPDDNKLNQEVQKRKQTAQVTEEQYREQLTQAGLTEEELRDKIRRELAINALRERERTRVSAPTDAEINKYYADNKAQFVAERGADISMIMVTPGNNGGEAGAEQKIKTIYEQLRSGNTDFATVAAQKSEDQASALRGGQLGFASEAGLRQIFPSRPDIPAMLMSLKDGQFTDPIKDPIPGNWYIFKLNRKQEQPRDLTLNDVRPDIINAITQQRQQILLQALMLITMAETTTKNLLAERIVQNPQSIVEMRPSQLLESSQGQQQAQPRIENQNQAAESANRPASSSAANANSR